MSKYAANPPLRTPDWLTFFIVVSKGSIKETTPLDVPPPDTGEPLGLNLEKSQAVPPPFFVIIATSCSVLKIWSVSSSARDVKQLMGNPRPSPKLAHIGE